MSYLRTLQELTVSGKIQSYFVYQHEFHGLSMPFLVSEDSHALSEIKEVIIRNL